MQNWKQDLPRPDHTPATHCNSYECSWFLSLCGTWLAGWLQTSDSGFSEKGQKKNMFRGILLATCRRAASRLQLSEHLKVNGLGHFLQQAVVDNAESSLLPDDGARQLQPDVLSQLHRLLDGQHGCLQGLLAPCNHNMCHFAVTNVFHVCEVRGWAWSTCFAVQPVTSYRNTLSHFLHLRGDHSNICLATVFRFYTCCLGSKSSSGLWPPEAAFLVWPKSQDGHCSTVFVNWCVVAQGHSFVGTIFFF